MELTTPDILIIIGYVFTAIGLYIKLKTDMKEQEKHSALLELEIKQIKENNILKDSNFEKVLDKLEGSIEKLNECQMELTKAIIELRTEIKK